MGLATAVAVSAGLNAAGQIYAGDRAADATRDAARSSNALQRYMYDTNRADQAPYRQVGVDALQQLSQLYGPNADFSGFADSPDYQFALQQGTQALDRSAASRGRLYSDAQLQGAQRFGQGLASQQFGNYFNRLSSLAGIGQSATNQLGAYGQNYANQVGQNYMNAGIAQASAYMNRGNALSGLAGDFAYGAGRGLFGGGGVPSNQNVTGGSGGLWGP
jgi:hypothetical protein